MRYPFLCLLAALACVASRAADPVFRVTVSAGKIDRAASVVSFAPPGGLTEVFRLIEAGSGREIPSQREVSGRITFLMDKLAAGQTANYRLSPGLPETRGPGAAAKLEAGVVKLTAGGRPVLNYQGEPGAFPRPDIKPIYRRGGYLHPILTPSGRLVSDDFPPNHIHHHGVWSPWTKTEFEGRHPDFWNMGDGKGTVEFVGFDRFWHGPVQAGFAARHRFVDLTALEPKTALNETWQLSLFNLPASAGYSMFELVITQRCATTSPLRLPKYHYGGLGFRGNRAWDGATNTTFLTSEGITDRLKGNETRARWCHVGGLVDGQPAGLAILCHPDNFRAPQPVRLHPTEPFFCFAPSQLGDWEITPGQDYVARYRFLVMDGPANAALIEQAWADYASPMTVKVERE